MKILSIIILFLFNSNVVMQNKDPKTLIKSFLNELTTNELSVAEMYEKGLLPTSLNDSNLASRNLADSIYNVILVELRKKITENSRVNDLEILTIQEGVDQKNYNERLVIPDVGKAYLIYNGNTLLTKVLVIEDRIAAFSVMNKGGSEFFLKL